MVTIQTSDETYTVSEPVMRGVPDRCDAKAYAIKRVNGGDFILYYGPYIVSHHFMLVHSLTFVNRTMSVRTLLIPSAFIEDNTLRFSASDEARSVLVFDYVLTTSEVLAVYDPMYTLLNSENVSFDDASWFESIYHRGNH